MPQFLFETGPTGGPHLDDAGGLAARRFPEVVVEHRYAVHDDGRRDVWVCRAPSKAHIERWAAAARLELRSLHQVDADVSPQTRERRRP
ncbi:MAG: hypothetical protein GEV08_08315 [Acidimicrobiia bacterium]|nr:hypothetical protein [Acidimicrobiia bacterium]